MTIHVQRLRFLMPMIGIALTIATTVSGQGRVVQPGSVHELHSALVPPGAIAQDQLIRDASFRGYFQPVELYGPEGSSISLVVDGKFQKPQRSPVRVGMLIGRVYRFRVTGIKRHEGFEVFPTVEVINRMYPPKDQAAKFPIPIQLTEEELALALSGQFVTRVIYLENPRTALPLRQAGNTLRYYEIAPDQDPIQVADELGRPMAILRMGSRIPAYNESIHSFSYGSPPLLMLPRSEPAQVTPAQHTQPFPNQIRSREAAASPEFEFVPQAPGSSARTIDFTPRVERRSR